MFQDLNLLKEPSTNKQHIMPIDSSSISEHFSLYHTPKGKEQYQAVKCRCDL